jgi:hypothetical protein
MKIAVAYLLLVLSSPAIALESALFKYSTDKRLVKDLVFVGRLENGLSVYGWSWNEKSHSLDPRYALQPADGGFAPIGFLAQDLLLRYPTAVYESKDGYLRIDIEKLARLDQFIRWKVTSTGRTTAGRCAPILGTPMIICF